MKGDFTRFTFDSRRHYRNLLSQQGRVAVDADPNEETGIASHRIETETRDAVGDCGGPLHYAAFALQPQGANLLIGAGRYYVDGILCENEDPVQIDDQPDLSDVQKIVLALKASPAVLDFVPFPPPAGIYLAYLDAWFRHVTALEDPRIRELALNGPDTGTRIKTVWQVRLLRVGNQGDSVNCLTATPAWDTLITGPTGKIKAQAKVDASKKDPCVIKPSAGYRRLENQLYRVEVHESGPRGTATFKWARDNGSVVTAWLGKSGDVLTVGTTGKDKVLGFATGQWVELTDDSREESDLPGTFVQLEKAVGNELTIRPATATGPIDLSQFPKNPKVRRWDNTTGLLKPSNTSNFVALEGGIEVSFSVGTYRTGDYWLIPARTDTDEDGTGDIEWPKDGPNNPRALSPHGVDHHYCRLAVLSFDGTSWTALSDCRDLFPPTTELTNLLYVGGDGQEAMPVDPLPQVLQVRVLNGEVPVQNALVRFATQSAGLVAADKAGLALAGVTNSIDVRTGADGLASCAWKLDPDVVKTSQRLEATLRDGAGNAMPGQVIGFTANLSVATQVAYVPNPHECPELVGTQTVQQAIDLLCRHTKGGCAIVVGPDQRLDKVLVDLLKAGQKDISICLLPGTHHLPQGLTLPPPGAKIDQFNLKIEGSGWGSRIVLDRQSWVMAKLGSCILRDVVVFCNDFEKERKGARQSVIALDGCQSFTLDGCHLYAHGFRPLLTIAKTRQVCIKNTFLWVDFSWNQTKITTLGFKAATFSGEDGLLANLSRSVMELPRQFDRATPDKREEFLSEIERFAVKSELLTKQQQSYLRKEAIPFLRSMPPSESGKALPHWARGIQRLVAIAPALVLADGEGVVSIVDSTIGGFIQLYGMGTPIGDKELEKLVVGVKNNERSFDSLGGHFMLRNNAMTALTIDQSLAKGDGKIEGIFRRVGMLDNTFFGHLTFVLGHSLSFQSNRFELPSGKDVIPAVLCGQNASIIGNSTTAVQAELKVFLPPPRLLIPPNDISLNLMEVGLVV